MNRITAHLIYIAITLTLTLSTIGSAALITFIIIPQATGRITLLATIPATIYGLSLHQQFITKDREEREALNTHQ